MNTETEGREAVGNPTKAVDMVNHPPHYTRGIETIDIIKSKLTLEEYIGYMRGTIIKYITRLGYKGSGEDMINDVGKIIWYAKELESYLKEKNHE